MGNVAIFRPTHGFPIPVVGADDIESLFLTVTCRGGRPCPPSKSGDFLRSFVGADAHIGPLKCCGFASDFRKTRQFRRADRVVRPYDAKSKPNAITSDRPCAGAFPFGRWDGSMWASTPTAQNRKCSDFSTHTRFSNTGCRGKIETQYNNPHPPLRRGIAIPRIRQSSAYTLRARQARA